MPPEKVIVAVSGGVDSAVAAALLQQQGWDVQAVYMQMTPAAAAEDARRVAGHLQIPFHLLDLEKPFQAVLDYFAGQYAVGRTPNPCAWCNRRIKFAHLVQLADSLAARFVATGHHVRVCGQQGRFALRRGCNAHKDQSYMLFDLPRSILPRLVFPLGELADKEQVRTLARQFGLPVADKPDSQDICFHIGDHYAELLADRAPGALRPGPIVDEQGRRLGDHNGVGRYTIGQRRGLGVAAAEPLYVTRIDPATATVTLGPRSAVAGTTLTADGVNWHIDPPSAPFDAEVQIRYRHKAVPARIHPLGGDSFRADFAHPLHAITPGQVAALYLSDRLLAGGWIR